MEYNRILWNTEENHIYKNILEFVNSIINGEIEKCNEYIMLAHIFEVDFIINAIDYFIRSGNKSKPDIHKSLHLKNRLKIYVRSMFDFCQKILVIVMKKNRYERYRLV